MAPVLPEQWAAADLGFTPMGAPRSNGLRVLVVEDNADTADSLAILLKLRGADVRVARSGPDALTAASETELDVVLLDIALPGMDGYNVARRIRELPAGKNPRLIAITG